MLITALLVSFFVGALAQCPPAESLTPCICNAPLSKTGDPYVTCEGLTSAGQLTKPLDSLRNTKLASFHLEHSNIGQLPSDIFSGTDIRSLTIYFTSLRSLGEMNKPPFLGLEKSLEDLEIIESFVDEKFPMRAISLAHLKKLNLLIIDSNLLPVIGNDWFESGPYSLKELYLIDVSTEVLGSHVFSALSSLVKFTMTGTKIKALTRKMFPMPAVNLEALDFSDNQLLSLPEDMFHGMPSLKEVYLSNNAISTFAEVVWAPVWSQLDHVHVSGNSMICDENIKWIYYYRLPEILFGECGEPAALKSRNLTSLTIEDFN